VKWPFIAIKHGRDGSRCPISTDRDLDLIVQTQGWIGYGQLNQDLDKSRWGISIHLAHAWYIPLKSSSGYTLKAYYLQIGGFN